jgi:hypothetical protein
MEQRNYTYLKWQKSKKQKKIKAILTTGRGGL